MVFAKTFFSNQAANANQMAEEDAAASRWREIILKLSDTLREAADERSDLSPVLMEALHNALENLLLLGQEADLIALEEWVDQERASRAEEAQLAAQSLDNSLTPVTQVTPPQISSDERKASNATSAAAVSTFNRRFAERRFAERRISAHFHIDDSQTAAPGDVKAAQQERRAGLNRRSGHERRT